MTSRTSAKNTEVSWLIEETWSGYIHYVHRDFDHGKWIQQCRRNDERRDNGLFSEPNPIVTKNVAEAKRFPSESDAKLWLAIQPRWMREGDQYRPREHMWPAPSDLPSDGRVTPNHPSHDR